MTAARRISPLPRRWSFALAGLLLGVGATFSYLVVWHLQTESNLTPGDAIVYVASHGRVWLLATLPGLLGVAWLGWTIGRRQDQLLEQSRTDPLTELPNLAGHRARLVEELARASRHGTPLSLLLVDVDHLKAINDDRGHAAGDEALRRVAEAMRRSCRATDHAARVGGDEFAILASGAGLGEALSLAERVRASVRFVGRAPHRGVGDTVSIGVADVASVGKLDAAALRAAADAALYRAKATGRDRVEGPSPESAPARPAFARLVALS